VPCNSRRPVAWGRDGRKDTGKTLSSENRGSRSPLRSYVDRSWRAVSPSARGSAFTHARLHATTGHAPLPQRAAVSRLATSTSSQLLQTRQPFWWSPTAAATCFRDVPRSPCPTSRRSNTASADPGPSPDADSGRAPLTTPASISRERRAPFSRAPARRGTAAPCNATTATAVAPAGGAPTRCSWGNRHRRGHAGAIRRSAPPTRASCSASGVPDSGLDPDGGSYTGFGKLAYWKGKLIEPVVYADGNGKTDGVGGTPGRPATRRSTPHKIATTTMSRTGGALTRQRGDHVPGLGHGRAAKPAPPRLQRCAHAPRTRSCSRTRRTSAGRGRRRSRRVAVERRVFCRGSLQRCGARCPLVWYRPSPGARRPRLPGGACARVRVDDPECDHSSVPAQTVDAVRSLRAFARLPGRDDVRRDGRTGGSRLLHECARRARVRPRRDRRHTLTDPTTGWRTRRRPLFSRQSAGLPARTRHVVSHSPSGT